MTDSFLFTVLYVLYFAAAALYAFTTFSTRRSTAYLTRAVLLAGLVCHTVLMAERWWIAGRPPMSNMFETLVFFSWALILFYLFVEFKYGLRILGLVASLGALLSLGYATLIFPGTVEPLMPALKNSFWLTTHVSICFLGYGAFAVAYVMALICLMQRSDRHRLAASYITALTLVVAVGGLVVAMLQKSGTIALTLALQPVLLLTLGALVGGAILMPAVGFLPRLLVSADAQARELLELAMHRTVALGFVFLTVGIITGAVWAQQAWGRYWGWDPKETWSFITWLIYGIFLHIRFAWNRKGVVTIWLAVLGFAAVVFTYFGVNFLLTGLHSYAR